MRIAHIVAPTTFGGLETVVGSLCKGLATRGHSVLLIVILDDEMSPPDWADRLSADGVTVEPIRCGRRAYRVERDSALTLCRQARIEIVHTHGSRVDVVTGSAATRWSIPAVSTVHGFVARGWRGRVYGWLHLRALRRFSTVIAVSDQLAATLRAAGVRASRIRVIPNGLPAGGAAVPRLDARRVLGVPHDARVIGWVGRVSHEKGPDIIVDAIRHLQQDTAILCVIGDGPELPAMRARVAACGLDGRVVFAGALHDASRLLGAFDVLALSSRTEGTPMVVLEAALAGVPVVAPAVGGVPDLLGESGGWLAAPASASALAACLDLALCDPLEAARRAATLRQRLEDREKADGWVDQYVAAYERARGSTPTAQATD